MATLPGLHCICYAVKLLIIQILHIYAIYTEPPQLHLKFTSFTNKPEIFLTWNSIELVYIFRIVQQIFIFIFLVISLETCWPTVGINWATVDTECGVVIFSKCMDLIGDSQVVCAVFQMNTTHQYWLYIYDWLSALPVKHQALLWTVWILCEALMIFIQLERSITPESEIVVACYYSF